MNKEALVEQITEFLELHNVLEREWLDLLNEDNIAPLNMNSIKVARVQSDSDILIYINKYVGHISKLPSYIGAVLGKKGIVRVRVKEPTSIIQKLRNYIEGPTAGEVKLHKCLNDLLGIRIVLDDYDIDEMVAFLSQQFPAPVIVLDATKKSGYKGIHLYTTARLGHFKWEVQIWREGDYNNNICLHETHKRGYIGELNIIHSAIGRR